MLSSAIVKYSAQQQKKFRHLEHSHHILNSALNMGAEISAYMADKAQPQ
jgi:hypothetical protein